MAILGVYISLACSSRSLGVWESLERSLGTRYATVDVAGRAWTKTMRGGDDGEDRRSTCRQTSVNSLPVKARRYATAAAARTPWHLR